MPTSKLLRGARHDPHRNPQQPLDTGGARPPQAKPKALLANHSGGKFALPIG
jgi:hypothetical protein